MSNFFASDDNAIFWKIVAWPARDENRMCSLPRAGDATAEKITEKNREKFSELNFSHQTTSLSLLLCEGGCNGDLNHVLEKSNFRKSHCHRKQKIVTRA